MPLRPSLLAAAVLALPCTAAHATDFNVSTSAGLTSALTTASSNGTADRILLAPGAYTGAFSYSSNEDLDIAGAGQSATEILDSGPSDALDLIGASATFHVTDLTVAMNTNTPHGIWISGDGTIERTTVTMAAGATGIGILAGTPGLALKHDEIDGGGGSSSRGVYFQQTGASTITDSTFYGTGQGLVADTSGTTVTAARLQFSGPTAYAVSALFGASITLSDSSIDLGNHDGTALTVGDSGNPSNFTGSINANRITVAGDGTHDQHGAFLGSNSVADNFSIALHDSVITAVKAPLGCFEATGTATITTDYSSVPSTGNTDSCGGGISQTHPVTNANLGFVNAAAGDYRLTDGSPLVDAGDPAALAATTDLAGAARPVDGNGDGTAGRDVGAYEYQPPAPPAAPTPDPVSAPTAAPTGGTPPATDAGHDAKAPVLGAVKLHAKRASFTLSQAATVRVTIERHVGRHWKRIKGSFHLVGAKGKDAVRITAKLFTALRPGRYRATFVARNAAGKRSKARHVTFRVRRLH